MNTLLGGRKSEFPEYKAITDQSVCDFDHIRGTRHLIKIRLTCFIFPINQVVQRIFLHKMPITTAADCNNCDICVSSGILVSDGKQNTA